MLLLGGMLGEDFRRLSYLIVLNSFISYNISIRSLHSAAIWKAVQIPPGLHLQTFKLFLPKCNKTSELMTYTDCSALYGKCLFLVFMIFIIL